MSRFMMIDIGAGTLDLLWYDSQSGEHFKAVAPSPVRTIAWKIEKTQGPLVVSGVEMGGGPVSAALRQRARSAAVVMAASAAATLHHDLDKVRGWGVRIASQEFLARCLADPGYTSVTLGDVQPERIGRLMSGLDLPLNFDALALCAQDHGVAPAGVSHLDFRHTLFQKLLAPAPQPHRLLFRSDEVPPAFNRLAGMARCAAQLNAAEIFVMDSGMAAILGASQDMQLRGMEPVMVLDIATSHTVLAVLAEGQLAGFLEYHTQDLTLERLETLMRDLADGRIDHAAVLAQGGHGAWLRQAVGFANLKAILATGPKRRLLAQSRLPIIWGAPWGDNMMTGTVGLLEAVRRRKGLAPIRYL
jgi:uncharacterized protein (DUF1786 family)